MKTFEKFINEKSKENIKTNYFCDEKNLPKNIKHRTGEEYGKKPTPEMQKKIDATKHLITSLPDEAKVYYVNFEIAKDVVHFGDLVEGGNECAYPNFIPRNEIWIDDVFKPSGGKSDKQLKTRTNQIMAHEAIERKKMLDDPNREYFKKTSKTRINKEGEDGAHIDANKIEKQIRNGKITSKEAIEKFYKKKK